MLPWTRKGVLRTYGSVQAADSQMYLPDIIVCLVCIWRTVV